MKVPDLVKDNLRGIDVSVWQGRIDWAKVYREAGPGTAWNLHFVGIKSGESNYSVDKCWADNWMKAGDVGFKHRIAYHFFHPKVSAREQANLFLTRLTIAGLGADDAVALDLEVDDGLVPTVVSESAKQFVELVEDGLGRRCIVYTGAWFIDGIVKPGNPLAERPLWVAGYTAKPRLPVAWKDWTIWQYGADGFGSVPGVDVGDHVDHNAWRSSDPEDLRQFVRGLYLKPVESISRASSETAPLAESMLATDRSRT